MRTRTGLLLPLALCLALAGCRAEERSLAIEHFDAEIIVHEDGTLSVTEQLRVSFVGAWNGIYREISLRHETAGGWQDPLRLRVERVTDEAGERLVHNLRRREQSEEIEIWVPEAENAVRSVLIHYTVENALRFFEDATHREGGHDELYWNVTGHDWQMPIHRATARIRLPDGVAGLEAWAYTGALDSQARDAEVVVEGNEVRVRAHGAFAPGEGLTVAVAWAPGVIPRPLLVPPEPPRQPIPGHWLLALPALAFLLLFGQWWMRGREPRRDAIVVRHEPPEGLTPAEVGTLVDHWAAPHDVTATLVDLAVRGYLIIEEKERPPPAGPDYLFHLVRDPSAWEELKLHERRYLEALFHSDSGARPAPGRERVGVGADGAVELAPAPRVRSTVALSRRWRRLGRSYGGIREAVYHSLHEQGLYREYPHHLIIQYLALAGALAVLSFAALVVLAEADRVDSAALARAGALTAAIVAGFAFLLPARTAAGVRMLEQVLGFREFLLRVESDRYRRMITSPELFERYLPFAIALRIEKRWAAAFDGIDRSPPSWYRGAASGGFRASSFAASVSHMARNTGRVASSSSGSGGGGRSGRGSGGGGGRGF